MVTKLQLRRATAADFTTANKTLALGEPGYEADTGKLKLGDGVSAWTALPYFGSPALRSYTSDADKLGGSDAHAGDVATIADGGGRMELYLGGGQSSPANWIVLLNPVNLTVNNSSGSDVTVNGVLCPTGSTTVVGWVDPADLVFAGYSVGLDLLGITIGGQTVVQMVIFLPTSDGPVSLGLGPFPRGAEVSFTLTAD